MQRERKVIEIERHIDLRNKHGIVCYPAFAGRSVNAAAIRSYPTNDDLGFVEHWNIVKSVHAISAEDWEFFYSCYERTYLEHGNPPYLRRDFFQRMAATMPENWLLFIAERDGHSIASSLIALDTYSMAASGTNAAGDWAAPGFAPRPPPALRAPP